MKRNNGLTIVYKATIERKRLHKLGKIPSTFRLRTGNNVVNDVHARITIYIYIYTRARIITWAALGDIGFFRNCRH